MTNLEELNKAYYEGKPLITDEEYDAIDTSQVVGYTPVGDTAVHSYPMWSLQKAYDDENPLSGYSGTISKSPKLDGAAVSIEYLNGFLSIGLTRGNGEVGVIITDKIRTLVPLKIPFLSKAGVVQVVGEVVAPKHIKNARNYAAGALNLKSVDEFATRELKFIAYGISARQSDSWSVDMWELSKYVDTVTCSEWDEYPQDGVVHRVDNYAEFDALGYTSKFPRGAYAHKVRQAGSITTLKDVEWKVGRSGVVSPVAILEPVDINGAMVSRATLHNMAYIQSLGLEIGCKVEVIRAGEIIPRIVRRVDVL